MTEIEKKWSMLAVKSLIYGLLCLPLFIIHSLNPGISTTEIEEISKILMVPYVLYSWLTLFFVFQAVRFGIYGVKETRKNSSVQKGTGFAIAGILLGSTVMVMPLISIYLWEYWMG